MSAVVLPAGVTGARAWPSEPAHLVNVDDWLGWHTSLCRVLAGESLAPWYLVPGPIVEAQICPACLALAVVLWQPLRYRRQSARGSDGGVER